MATVDQFPNNTINAAGPARKSIVITPSDTVELNPIPKRIYVGTGGNVTLRAIDSVQDVVYKNAGNGVYLNVRAQYVRATGTTAADLLSEA